MMKPASPTSERRPAARAPLIRVQAEVKHQARRANRQTPDRREAVRYAMLRTG
jgi:hypothetical protein